MCEPSSLVSSFVYPPKRKSIQQSSTLCSLLLFLFIVFVFSVLPEQFQFQNLSPNQSINLFGSFFYPHYKKMPTLASPTLHSNPKSCGAFWVVKENIEEAETLTLQHWWCWCWGHGQHQWHKGSSWDDEEAAIKEDDKGTYKDCGVAKWGEHYGKWDCAFLPFCPCANSQSSHWDWGGESQSCLSLWVVFSIFFYHFVFGFFT